MDRTVFTPEGWSVTVPLSQAVKVGRHVYCSGQVGVDPVTGRVAGPDVRAQTRQTLLNLEAVLVSAGSSLDRVDKCTVFLTRAEDFPAMNDVYRQFFSTQPPARSTVIVAGLARPDLVVEIECIAHI